MKKIIFLLFVSISLSQVSNACDICGCGVGNNYIGILPDFHKHIAGLRYRNNALTTHVGVGGGSSYLTTQERYHTLEAWGGWTIGDKVRLMASVPYNMSEKTNQGITQHKSGMGDITLAGYYQFINKKKTVGDKLLVQSLWMGGGIKFATGEYNPADKNNTSSTTNLFQLGTGSTDFNINAMYDVRLQDMGINLTSAYKMSTANKYDYKYGNKFNLTAQAYYKFRIKNKLTLAPNAGVQFEQAQLDLDNGTKTTVSGGRLLQSTLGVEAATGKFAFGANFQTPLSQNLANGIVKADNRLMAHVAVMF